jgi:hypothetical protein
MAALVFSLTAGAWSLPLPSLDNFQNAFSGFTGDMAGSLAANSTIGSNWSDAFIGKFPHFGVGISTGSTFVAAGSLTPMFDAMSVSLPTALKGLGMPIPTAVATLKLGLPFLPMDIGVKGGYMPPAAGAGIKSLTGVSADFTSLGVQLRYALIRQNLLLPNLSLGAAYNYQKGSLKAPTGLGSQSLSVLTNSITLSSPDLNLAWTSSTFDFTAQVSKQLLFLVPYLGAGYTIGSSSVTGGLDSTITTDYPTGLSGLAAAIVASGGTAPDFSATGFSYTATSATPVLRVYGGLSFRIILVDIDTQVIYVPLTQGLGLSATLRVQL